MKTENNKIIAKFMGDKKVNSISIEEFKKIPSEERFQYNGWFAEDLQYHSDWNWLMPVVEKIEDFRFSDHPNSMRFSVKIKHHSCRISDHEIEGKNFIHMGGFHSKIEAVYWACVEFINWFNQQKN